MIFQILSASGGLGVGAVVGSVVTHRLTSRREERHDQRDQTREAAVALRDALANLKTVIETSQPTGLVSSRTVVEAVTWWGRAYERWETWLPSNARHLHHSVACAVAEHFGAVGQGYRIPDMASAPLADNLDHEWQEKANRYVSYLISWMDESNRRREWLDRPHNFDDWLKVYNERMDAVARGEFTRFDRFLHRVLGA